MATVLLVVTVRVVVGFLADATTLDKAIRAVMRFLGEDLVLGG